MDAADDPTEEELISRAPMMSDLSALCRELNDSGAHYLVIGGFAIINSGYPRTTMDIDFVLDPSIENEAKVYKALESLPDKAVLELEAGDVAKHTVVRVGDEITVDLMASAGGFSFEDCKDEIVYREIDGVQIPFASPRLLWRLKEKTYREKDKQDLIFLREHYSEEIFGTDSPE